MASRPPKFQWPFGADFKNDLVPDANVIMSDGKVRKFERRWFHVQGTGEDGQPYLVLGQSGEPETFPHYRDAARFRDSLPREMDPKVLKVSIKFLASVIGPFQEDGVVFEGGMLA